MIGYWSLVQRIGRLVMDWHALIGTELTLDRRIGDGLADFPRIGFVKDY